MMRIPLIIDVPASAPSSALVYRVLDINHSLVADWSSAGMVESTASTAASRSVWAVEGGVSLPDAGGYIMIGVDDGATITAIGEVAVDPSPVAIMAGLTGMSVEIVNAVQGGEVTVYAADTWSFTVSTAALGNLTSWSALAFVVKRDDLERDDAATLLVRSDSGLQRANGAAAASSLGSLAPTATAFSVVVSAAVTALLHAGRYRWWLKGFGETDEALTLATGDFRILRPGVRAIQ